MANETSTRAPLTATVGERLDEKAHEGATPGVDRAAASVQDLGDAGYGAQRVGAEGSEGERRHEAQEERPRAPGRAKRRAGPQRTRSGPRGSRIGWAVVAGFGTWMVVGMVGRAFRR